MDAYTANLLGALAIGCSDAQEAAMAAVGLDPIARAALLAVHARPGSTIRDIALTTGLTHPGAVRVIDRLSHRGWVERRTGRDRRTVALRCTPEGRRQAVLALARRRAALLEVMQGLTASELADFRGLAKKVLSRLPTHRPDAWRICRHCDHGVCTGAECPVGSAVP